MNNELVSVIIPVYNTVNYISRCIDSILAQETDNWELILVDDESTDGSRDICERYAANNKNIYVIHQKNQGPAAARQNGLNAAKGKWIMFVDSDDWLDSRILKVLLQNQVETGAAMVCCNFVNVNDKNEKQHIVSFKERYIDCNNAQECMLNMHKTRYLSGSPCTKLIKKELFEGIDFCSDVTIGEDYSMIVQLAQKAGKVRILSEELYYRYVRRGSISHMGYSKRHEKAFDNYMRVRRELIGKYPELKEDIIGFHTEYEMAVITAMCRNKHFDKLVINKLRNDLKENMKLNLKNKSIPIYMKICAVMIAHIPGVFIVLFRMLYLCTGR